MAFIIAAYAVRDGIADARLLAFELIPKHYAFIRTDPFWCWDWYGTPYAGGSDPRGPVSGDYRVLRGSDWNDNAWYARCADRSYLNVPSNPTSFIGFRCVRGL